MHGNIDLSTPMIQESPIMLENFTYGEVTLPKFSNKLHENPMQYLKELENFFKLRMNHQRFNCEKFIVWKLHSMV